MAVLDAKIAEAERAIAEGETTAEKRRAMDRKEDLMRLKRVEQIYVRVLAPQMLDSVPYEFRRAQFCQSWVDGVSCCSNSCWRPCQLQTASRHILVRVPGSLLASYLVSQASSPTTDTENS